MKDKIKECAKEVLWVMEKHDITLNDTLNVLCSLTAASIKTAKSKYGQPCLNTFATFMDSLEKSL